MSDFPRTLKIVTVWALLGLVVFLGFRALEAREQRTRFEWHGDTVTLRRAGDGHYHWPGRVNGVAVDFLVDTGATRTALPRSLARQAGLQESGRVMSSTAGGVVSGAQARADVSLEGGIEARQLRVVVLPDLEHALLGMDVLGRLSLQQRGDVLTVDLGAR
ncbi:retroviral-like aspartic protease family protein [Caldimonas thermodepolymerans]|jgi:clan AA aspartic protease, TIGR02281 family|uniref:Aspartyl protease family protein n=1 Tax=Caldimonas thermodepolymerans TaxID=215580 RepID=A0A2S5T7R6_9BURK|nr:retropepsin-like aspartic protease [Caldimonas thermodepolymerans]PPE71021.1 TIGR02281 family clan AA aspartic protease [Caldimonas thermodepolymerans]QPC31321.1 retroviral-like aspartic protease family protein [Caldimonas thermodepolymerans]RDH99714.1 aspartyl protease family protein [Caldimonas thermodepolymerans]TCP07560.1 aspartyl protease family protein [Caldimonas thermodepolymerans]UZG44065.1 retroviral-like aspartic protease family protein [Caldimonas thermodepolymerans]